MKRKLVAILLILTLVLGAGQWAQHTVSANAQATTTDNLTQQVSVSVESPQASDWAANPNVWAGYAPDDFPYIPKRLIDGKCESAAGYYISNNMTSQTDPVTITLTFAECVEIRDLTFWPAIEGSKVTFFPIDFTIRIQNQYGQWETVEKVTDYQVQGTEGQSFEFAPIVGNCVELTATKLGTRVNANTGQNEYALYMSEIEVHGTQTNASLFENVALNTNGAVASCERSDESMVSLGYTVSAINDGIAEKNKPSFLSYESSTAKSMVEVQLDLDGWHHMNMVALMPHVEGEKVICFPKSFAISALTPNGWKVLREEQDYQLIGNDRQYFSFSEITASAIKVTAYELTQNNTTMYTAYAFYLNELEVYGEKTTIEEAVYKNIAWAQNGVTVSHTTPLLETGFAYLYGFTADKLIDGNFNAFYLSDEYTSEAQEINIQLDFHQYYKINQINFYPYLEVPNGAFGFPIDFRIEVYTTEGWKTVVTESDYQVFASATVATSKNAFEISEIECSAIRMVTSKLPIKYGGRDDQHCIGISEIEVLGIESDLSYCEPSDAWKSIAPHQHTSAGKVSGQDLDATAVNDADFGTLYTGTSYNQPDVATGEYVLINLDKPHKIGQVRFYTNYQNGTAYGFPKDFVIRVYSDGEWKTVAERKNVAATEETYSIQFPEVKAERVELYATKLSQTDTKGKYALQLKEMEVYGVPTITSSTADLNMNGINDAEDGDVLREILIDKRTLVFKDGDCNSDGMVDVIDLVSWIKYNAPKETTVQGTTYYVNSSASKEGDGLSIERPLRTLEEVNQLILHPGDCVLFARGSSYTGQLRVLYSGTKEAPIVYGAYGEGDLPQLHGEGAVGATVYGENVSYVTVSELEITNAGDITAYHRGVYLLAASESIYGVQIINCYVHDVDSNIMELEEEQETVITALRLADPHWLGGIVVRAGSEAFPGNATLLRSLTVNDVLIQGNRVERCMQTGIAAGGLLSATHESKGISVLGNVVSNCYGDGIILFSSHAGLIEGNLSDSNAENDAPKKAFAGIWTVQSSADLLQYNESRNMGVSADGQGFDVDGGCYGTLVQYNYAHDNYGGALLLMQNVSGGVTVRNNISQNDGRYAINIGASDKAPYLNFKAYHNIIYTNASTSVISFMAMWEFLGTSSLGEMRNNIIYATAGAKVTKGNIGNYVTFHGNAYYGLTNSGDSNAYTQDPQFKAPGTAGNGMLSLSGYALAETSPYKDWGIR